MKRTFLLLTMLCLFVAAGCEQAPAGDPAFKKEKANMEELQPVQGQKLQEAPGA